MTFTENQYWHKLERWIKEHQVNDNGHSLRGNGNLAPEQDEIRKLKTQIKPLNLRAIP